MATLFLCLTAGSAVIMVTREDPVAAVALALNTAFWNTCAVVAS